MYYYARKKESPANSIFAFLAGAATMAAAGAYYLYGPKGDQHRKQMDQGARRLKRELVARMNEIEDITQEKYEDIVDEVLSRYELTRRITKDKAARISDSLKARWEEMKDAAERARMDAELELTRDDIDEILY